MFELFRDRSKWTLDEAVALCKRIEAFAPDYGCHVALTGGVLYKDGLRKDCDIIFYRIRQASAVRIEALFDRMKRDLHIERVQYGVLANPNDDPNYTGIWLQKGTYCGKKIDFLFPDEPFAESF